MLSDKDITREIRMADENMHIIPVFVHKKRTINLVELK